MSKAFVNPREYAEASKAERELVKGRGGYRPRKKPMTREEHRTLIMPEVQAMIDGPSLGEANALSAVLDELARTKDRVLPTDPLRRTALVVEEAGEALKEALDFTRAPFTAVSWRLREELVQVAAMAVRVLGAMDEEDSKKRKGSYRRRAPKE